MGWIGHLSILAKMLYWRGGGYIGFNDEGEEGGIMGEKRKWKDVNLLLELNSWSKQATLSLSLSLSPSQCFLSFNCLSLSFSKQGTLQSDITLMDGEGHREGDEKVGHSFEDFYFYLVVEIQIHIGF